MSIELKIERNYPLASFSSWQVGGVADYAIVPETIEEVAQAMIWAREKQLTITTLGSGTNVLISAKGIRGLTIHLRKLVGFSAEVREDDQLQQKRLYIECLAGTAKSELLKTFLKYKLSPALFLAGLPGDVGGGIVMNAGVGETTCPREFVEIVDWIEVLRLPDDVAKNQAEIAKITYQRGDLTWGYRHCDGWQPGVIVRAGLSWPVNEDESILLKVRNANQVRLSKQPLDMPSCGSVFANPTGHRAGQLIESVGLKGFTIGGAKVSEKHANFIVNFNAASPQEIHDIIKKVQSTVKEKLGIELRTEVVYLGEW